jgi:HPt (histidine-containing phosphotransfer) domain-containing protein
VIVHASSVDTDFFARLRLQDAAFSARLPAVLDALAVGRDADAPVPTSACSARLQHELHTLAGCAATFGYVQLGQAARALEQRLRVLQAFNDVPAVDWRAWFAQLDAMVAWARIDARHGVR